jgi:toxin-antitoxin system PIN domain toxin
LLVVDANVLLYAVNLRDRHHQAARRWLEAALSRGLPVAFSWFVLVAFLRIATGSFFPTPLAPSTAAEYIRSWLLAPSAVVIEPTSRHLPVLLGLVNEAGISGDRVSDAHLAALAAEHGGSVVSFDRDFLRFPGVDLIVPHI